MDTEKIKKQLCRAKDAKKNEGIKQKNFQFLRHLRVLRATCFSNVKPGGANCVGHERRHQVFNRQTGFDSRTDLRRRHVERKTFQHPAAKRRRENRRPAARSRHSDEFRLLYTARSAILQADAQLNAPAAPPNGTLA